jgi:hypothetical protein
LAVLDEFQVVPAALVMFCLLPSVSVAVAVNCSELPICTVAGLGVTAIVAIVAAITVTGFDGPELTLPIAALIGDEPSFNPFACPPTTCTTVGSEALQVACTVMSRVLPSLYVPVAVKFWVAPIGMLIVAGSGDMAMLCKVGAGLEPPPHATRTTLRTSHIPRQTSFLAFMRPPARPR